MPAERRRIAATAVVLAIAVAAVSACGGEREPVRIGVLADCVGFLGSTKDLTLAGAALPLLERGGARTERGEAHARIGGRRVELVPACTELTYLHLLILTTRRLVEEEGVDIVVGPIGGPESVVFRKLAARYPSVTFVAAYDGAQETTLRDPQQNLFRFTPAAPQQSAGLGSYAYDELGWRRAVVVAEGFDAGWELAAGFVAEFCALGGAVVERDWGALSQPDPSPAAARHAREADGVLVASAVTPPAPYMAAYAATAIPVGRRLLLTGPSFNDRRNLVAPGVDLSGVVVGGYIPVGSGGATMRAFRSSFRARFPQLSVAGAVETAVVPTYTALTAVAAALERTRGELGRGQAELRAALSTGVDAPQGRVRLDDNRQGSGPIYLERIQRVRGGRTSVQLVRRLTAVEQTFGGIFNGRTPSPSAVDPTCERRTPPPWAR